jgi:glycosyltransferase involved in cell wall biosynthesis
MKQKGIINNKHRTDIIYSGMDIEEFKHKDIQTITEEKKRYGIGNEFIVGMVSKLEPRKNYDDYLLIANEIIHRKHMKNIKFLIVGNGESEDDLKLKVEKYELSNNVVFTGYRKDVEKLYQIFNCFIITSLAEGIPQVCVQAAAAGLPILAYDIDGMSEIVFHNENGFLAPVKKWKQLTDYLVNIINDKRLLDKLSAASPVKLQGRWEGKRMYSDVRTLYKNICKNIME